MLVLLSALLGCNEPGFNAVSIRPTYGWADGCTSVVVGGAGFDDAVSGRLGDNELTSITPHEAPLDVGYGFSALTPPGAPGFADLTVVNGDGQTDTVESAFYYLACPGGPYVEVAEPKRGIAAGDTIVLRGCGFAAGMVAEVVSPDDLGASVGSAPLQLDCATAVASFTAPDVPNGQYVLLVTDGAGGVLFGSNFCDAYDTAYYGYTCEDQLKLVWGDL
jgi:hypothetical protein